MLGCQRTWLRCFDVGKPCLIITKEGKQPLRITTPDVREREWTFEKERRGGNWEGGEENGKVTVKSHNL